MKSQKRQKINKNKPMVKEIRLDCLTGKGLRKLSNDNVLCLKVIWFLLSYSIVKTDQTLHVKYVQLTYIFKPHKKYIYLIPLRF